MKSSNKGKDFCVFALPGLFCFLAVVMVPFVYGIYLTLTDWNGVSSVKNFVGLSNFAAVMRDAQFWKSLLLTFKYVIAVVVLVNVIAFLLAYILTRGIKGQNFFRAGFFIILFLAFVELLQNRLLNRFPLVPAGEKCYTIFIYYLFFSENLHDSRNTFEGKDT